MIYVTLVNRSSKALQGTWDGKHYVLEPGKHSFPEVMAEKFKLQNPIMGSEDPRTLQTQYLIGIVESGDPIDPIEQSDEIEKWDRTKLPEASRKVEVVPGRTGLYSARDVQSSLPVDANFVKA